MKQGICFFFLLSLIIPVPVVCAQISFDGSQGQPAILAGPEYLISANYGRQSGHNLFHSFHRFDLNQGEIAVFSGPASVTNIISRVTGPDKSMINGRITSEIPGADFFLINPRGLVFGPDASLEISGSFYGSTADYLKFEDQQVYSASFSQEGILTSASPEAFGFLTDTPAPIEVAGHLQGSEASTLSLVGGDMTISGTIEIIQGGTLCLSSLNSTGETNLTGTLTDNFSSLGNMTLSSGSSVISSGRNSAAIYIRSGNLLMENTLVGMYHTGEENDGKVDIKVRDQFQMTSGSSVLTINDGKSSGGAVHVDAGHLVLADASQIGTMTVNDGQAGDLTVSAASSITLSGKNQDNIRTGFFSQTTGNGSNGRISIDTPAMTLSDSSQIYSAANQNSGPAQDINLFTEYLFLDSNAIIVGKNMDIDTDTLQIQDGAYIWARPHRLSDRYEINVTARESVHISGQKEDLEQWRNKTHPLYTGIHTDVFANTDGNAGTIHMMSPSITVEQSGQIAARSYTDADSGDIYIETDNLVLNSGGQIGTDSFGSTIYNGSAGNIFISATESVRISGEIGQLPSGLFSRTRSKGSSGLIQVSSPLLTIDDNGSIAVNTGLLSYGDAGEIRIHVDRLEIFDDGSISSAAGGTGKKGQVTVTADEKIHIHEGIISSLCTYQGTAGDILLTSPLITLSGGRISSETRNHNNGGDITIFAGDFYLYDGSLITSSSSDTGDAGSISLFADTYFNIQDSAIKTETVGSDGGDIHLGSALVFHMVNSDITTSVTDDIGNGGNITIDPVFIILDASRIMANAHEGGGGNISIKADYFFPDAISIIQASSALGIDGTITIDTPNIDLGSGFAILPEYRKIPELSLDGCETRTGADAGSLVRTGKGSIPPDPFTPLSAGMLFSQPVTD